MSSKNISLQVSKSPTTSTTSTSGPLFWGLVVWIPWKWKGTNLPLVETSNPQTKTSNFYITYITQKKLHPWIHKHEDCWKIPIHVQYLNRKYTDSTQNLGCCQLARHVKGTSGGGETSAHLEVLPGLRLTWSRSGRETSLSVHMEHPRPWGGWKSPQLRWGGWLVGWLVGSHYGKMWEKNMSKVETQSMKYRLVIYWRALFHGLWKLFLYNCVIEYTCKNSTKLGFHHCSKWISATFDGEMFNSKIVPPKTHSQKPPKWNPKPQKQNCLVCTNHHGFSKGVSC